MIASCEGSQYLTSLVIHSVPSMVSDLVSSDLGEDTLESLLFGGAAAPEQLPNKAKTVFPKAAL